MISPAASAPRTGDSTLCYRFTDDQRFSIPYSFFSYMKENCRTVSIDSLKNSPDRFSFTAFASPVPVIGFSPHAWVRLKAENSGKKPIRAYLQVADAGIDEIVFYHVRPDTFVSCTAGTIHAFSRRDVSAPDFIFHCLFPPHSVSTIYLRCKSSSSLELPLSVMDENSLFRKQRTDHFASGLIYGILWFFGVTALYLSFIYRDANFRNFGIFILHFCTMLAVRDGFFSMFMWPALPSLQTLAYNYFFLISLIWGILFCIYFFKVNKIYRLITVFGYGITAVCAAMFAYSCVGSPRVTGPILNLLALATMLYVMVIALLTFSHHDRASRFCFFAWYGFFLVVTARLIVYSLAVPVAPVMIRVLQVGYHYHIAILAVAVLTSIAISYRLRLIENERHAALLETEALQRKTLELRLSSLQARVQPHFLFNTLNTIANSIVVDPPGAERALVELSEFYRMTLRYSSRKVTRLDEEIDLIKRYLYLEKMKFGERLDFSFAIEDQSRDVLLPPMSLQILVENSLKHGIHPKIDGGSIHVAASKTGDTLKMIVDDTGIGMRNQKTDSGTGLSNLHSRLELMYHGDYSLLLIDKQTSQTSAETGVTAILEIPLQPVMTNIPYDRRG